MRFLAFVEYLLLALVLIVFVTQLFLPLWRGTAVFPFFRRERKLEEELTAARQENVEKDLRRRIERERRETPRKS